MLEIFVKDFCEGYVFDGFEIYDSEFFDFIGIPECDYHIRYIKNDFDEIFHNFDLSNLPYQNIISYDVDYSFFDRIAIELECKNEEDYLENPSMIQSIEWNNEKTKISKINIKQREVDPSCIDFRFLRYSLMTAYYEYLKVTNTNHLFVDFVNMIRSFDIGTHNTKTFTDDYINEIVSRCNNDKKLVSENIFLDIVKFYKQMISNRKSNCLETIDKFK